VKAKNYHLYRRLLLSLSLVTLLSASAQAQFTLTIAPSERGTVTVSPEMETYPEGAEVTLTAIPDEGYRFIDWDVVRDSGGAENQRGGVYQENPHTFLIRGNTSVRVAIGGEITPNVHYDNLAVRGDDPNGSGSALKSTAYRHSQFPDYPIAGAQRFRAGSVGNVTSVEMGFARLGSPGGHFIVSVREVDETTGNPGDLVGILGEIQGNSLPQIDWCARPLKLKPVRVEGFVGGLEPGQDYFLHWTQAPDDLPQDVLAPQWCGEPSQCLVIDLVSANGEGQFGDAPVTRFDYPWPPAGLFPSDWVPHPSALTMRFRIEGPPPAPAPELKIERAVQISWPASESVHILETSPSLGDPWEAVTEPVHTVDGENRVTILINSGDAYFRLRLE